MISDTASSRLLREKQKCVLQKKKRQLMYTVNNKDFTGSTYIES